LHAQTHAISFYAKADFEPNGPIFDEASIPHVEMRLIL
jgi:predicted GNAT family N-acyltransferase